MGGNSLIESGMPPTVENQFDVTTRAIIPIADLLERGNKLVLTHGNGPQVGFMQLRSELSKEYVHEVPLDSLVADSQGSIGYMIQRCLREELERRNLAPRVLTVVTEVAVDPDDPAFQNPTKPIGSFYDHQQAKELESSRGWTMVEDSNRGYRRVVPSPLPIQIVQMDMVADMLKAGICTITCGGGGIPIMEDSDGRIHGLEAVIDKDRASAVLGVGLGCRRMIVTTGVDAIYTDYLSDERKPLRETTVSQLQALAAQGQFPPGSMGPKVEASIYFLQNGGEEVIICHPDHVMAAMEGKTGTRITMG